MSADVDLSAADTLVFENVEAVLEDDDLDGAVHATRKGLKRLRSHLRLRRAAISPGIYADTTAELRAIGRILAPARDAFVLGSTLQSLESSEGWGPAADIIATHHEEAMATLREGPLQDVRHRIDRARAVWPEATEFDAESVADAVAATYHRGRAERALAATSGRAGEFHEWRKRVKSLRYQLEAVHAEEDAIVDLTELGEWLGSEHDHTVFIEFCDERLDLLPDRRDRYVLIDRAERRRDQLRTMALGSAVYSHDAETFAASVLQDSGTR